MIPIDLNKLPTERQSGLTLTLGILTLIIGFSSALSYRGDGGSSFFLGLLTLLFGIAFISLGNRKVIDHKRLLIFLKTLIESETKK